MPRPAQRIARFKFPPGFPIQIKMVTTAIALAGLGPVRYLATLIGSTDGQTMRWFILIVALLLDPAAVLLLMAATHRGCR